MYTPEAFKFDNQKDIESFIQEYSFATVISSNNAQPLITHTPVVRLSDRKLYGHFAISNPHSQINEGSSITLIFNGPHAYISPSFYKTDFNVPTWNYLSVHCHGNINFVDSTDTVKRLFYELIAFYEGSDGWKLPEEKRYLNLQSAIRFFYITNESFIGKAKFNQNKSKEDIDSVINALRVINKSDVADLMGRLNHG